MTQMKEEYHAKLGPSAAHRWKACTASINASVGLPNEGSDASRMGTACHAVSSECLQRGRNPSEYLGKKFSFCQKDGRRFEDFSDRVTGDVVVTHEVEITEDMLGFCETYVNFVLEQKELTGAELLVEQRLPIGHITGEEGAGGTGDAVLVAPKQRLITVIDAKFGQNKVVAFETVGGVNFPNDQLAFYAAGALKNFELFYDFDTVKLIIVQPPIHSVSEFTLSVAELNAHLETLKLAAEATRTNPTFVPGEHCTFCPARATCAARDKFVLTTALEGFEDLGTPEQVSSAKPKEYRAEMLGSLLSVLPMIRTWCEDIQQRAYNELVGGGKVVAPDGSAYKLVLGNKGNRKWANKEEAENALKKMRLTREQMYDFSLISPTTADKLAHPKKLKGAEPTEPVIGERQWATLQELITQSEAKPVIAPASDARDALTPGIVTDLSGFGDKNEDF